MLINCLNRHLHVASREEALRLVRLDREFWNVVSISSPMESPIHLTGAKRIFAIRFDDTESPEDACSVRPPRFQDLAAIFRFTETVEREPLLIHCQLGLSRSPAVALALICRELAKGRSFEQNAVNTLCGLRPQAKPNALVLRLGLEQFMTPEVAADSTVRLLQHPKLLANRFQTRQP